jgi:hypothetical protein
MIDPKNALTFTSVIPAKSQTNNTGNGGLDLKDYVGSVAVVVDIGVKTVGDNDGAIAVRVTTSSTNNISNGTNYGSSTIATTNNTAATGTITVDTRDALRYLFAVPAVTGTNSPAYPVSVVAVGQKRVQP